MGRKYSRLEAMLILVVIAFLYVLVQNAFAKRLPVHTTPAIPLEQSEAN